ncbi:MAG: TlpA family protein disulfide reductase [Acidobacteria bacterium]|nr:TlpA family protein disulfide reductase [Acidobacteriota bacterium]
MNRSVLSVALLAALFTFGCSQSSVSTETAEAAQAAGKEAPKAAPDFTLTDADGNEVTLSKLKGQVVLLNFWATWCGPCKIEMPWFIDFQRQYKDRGFTVVAVSLDEEGWDVVRPYAEEMQFNFPVVVGNDDLAEKFGDMYALPTTFVINKQGEIVDTHTGLVDRTVYEEEIESLL